MARPRHPKVKVTLQAIRKRLGSDPIRATPLTGERLIQVLLSIDADTLAGQRDAAMLLIGFYGGFRRSELAGIRRQHLDIDDNGVGIEVPRSKTSPDSSVWVPISRQAASRWDPVTALETWLNTLDARGHDGDGVWARITKSDRLANQQAPITDKSINVIVKRRILTSGLADASTYSAHSLRSGFVTEAKNRGIDEADIMKHTRHKSLATMRLYDRTSGWWQRNATTNLAL